MRYRVTRPERPCVGRTNLGVSVMRTVGLTRRCGGLLLALLLLVQLFLVPAAGAATTEPVPGSMSALGDSITRGFNACGFFFDCDSRSWSSGTLSFVNSHYLRILARNGSMSGRNYNDARTGARMADLAGQAQTAVSRGVEYVTIMMGANDACTDTEAAMTTTATYRQQADAALRVISQGLPTARIFVASVPDVARLWLIGKDYGPARNAWSNFGICQSLLANPTSTQQADMDRRLRVRQRVIEYNQQLFQACAAVAHCVFDKGAVFNYRFNPSQISTWDYFHPNQNGQQALADTTYRAGFAW